MRNILTVFLIFLVVAVLLCGILLCGIFLKKPKEGVNVLIITVDSLRPDHLGCYGYERATSPNIDRLAKRGVLFTQAISQSSWTSPSMISLLTSLYPPSHGVDSRGKSLPEGVRTPIEVLGENGYAVPAISYLLSIVPNYANLGFEHTEEKDIYSWLEKNFQKKFFLWYHFFSQHLPFDPPPPYDHLFDPKDYLASEATLEKVKMIRENVVIRKGEFDLVKEDMPLIISLYDGEIRYVDTKIGEILDKLEELGLEDRTIIVLTADHGEELMDHGFIGHASTSLAGTLYDEVIHVPLIISYPKGLPQGVIVDTEVQSIDIMPTVFDILGIPMEPIAEGRSLLPLIEGRDYSYVKSAFSETTLCGWQRPEEEEERGRVRAIRSDGWKLIFNRSPGGDSYELYNLKDDPGELENLVDVEIEVVDRLKQELFEWIFLSKQKADLIAHLSITKAPGIGYDPAYVGRKAPFIIRPIAGQILDYEASDGRVILEWTGESYLRYRVQYEVGAEEYRLTGNFPVLGDRQIFGPYPQELWRGLHNYNPWKFRVSLDVSPGNWSDWVTFNF